MKRLLAATDLSARSDLALRRAALLSREFSAALRIVHVVDGDQPPEIVAQECSQAGELLERRAQSLREIAGAPAEIMVKAGNVFQEIVDAAREFDADIIVMGSHRRRILRDVFVGTTIERVMRTGPHPVLMVPAEPSGPYHRVVAAVDLSEASANALLAARELKLLESAYVSLVHAFSLLEKGMMIYANIERQMIERHVAHEASEAKHDLVSFLAQHDLDNVAQDIRVEEGRAFSAIRKAVSEERPDLLVIGTRGLTGAKRILLGSVADEVLRSVGCDTLAVPPTFRPRRPASG
jgi:nucleotide-binding universal stress UspA family protein